ncbi:MAG: nuclear transport factor 2 family protein [Pseudomonadota bacterium]
MFRQILTGTIMAIVINGAALSKEQNAMKDDANAVDRLQVINTVKQVGSLADAGDFAALQALYAEEVMVDYSSLSGEKTSLKSAEKLMTEWASVLPGFDVTHHAISDIKVVFSDSDKQGSERQIATVTANVIADHFVNNMNWQVSGNYRYELIKQDGQWRIVYHQFNVESETGTRDVFSAAIENAAANPSTYLRERQARAVVTDFLVALEQKDMDAFSDVWSEDAVQDMPFSPEGFPKRVIGKENLIAHYAKWPEMSGDANFTDNLRFYPMRDANTIFVEYTGSVDVLTTGRKYEQTYAGLFQIEDGKISLFREYYDPTLFAYAFALDSSSDPSH